MIPLREQIADLIRESPEPTFERIADQVIEAVDRRRNLEKAIGCQEAAAAEAKMARGLRFKGRSNKIWADNAAYWAKCARHWMGIE